MNSVDKGSYAALFQDKDKLLDASSRVALAAYLHDLGKFAERAAIDVDEESLKIYLQLYCPYRK